MPTLIERIRELTEQIRSQADTKVTEDEAKRFRTRAKELSDPSNAIFVPTRRLELFKSKGIPVEIPLPNANELKRLKVRKVETAALPLPLLMEDGTICTVDIPRMTSATFVFFKKQLDAYERAIVLPSVTHVPSEEGDND